MSFQPVYGPRRPPATRTPRSQIRMGLVPTIPTPPVVSLHTLPLLGVGK
jgi:hypothetical protein